jgi:hypothetical protein
MEKSKPALFALLASLAVVGGLLALMLWFLARGRHLFQLAVVLALVFLGTLLLGVLSLALTMALAKPLPLGRLAGWAVSFLYPIAQRLCSLCGIKREHLAQSFISINNSLVLLGRKKCKPQQLLLLVPHCLQWDRCPHKLDSYSRGCKRCGACQLGELLALKEEYGIELALATGGTLARKVIDETRPRCVVAVACERDLIGGIMETRPLAVWGVLNQRPHGPCFNTRVDLAQIRKAIELFLEREVE